MPSKNSCRDKCGSNKTPETDCSCSSDCFREGNCCEDVDEFCVNFSILRKNKYNKIY